MKNNIVFSEDFADALSDYFKKHSDYSKIGVLVDGNTEEYCLPKIKHLLPEHVIIRTRIGEEHKTLDACRDIWYEMTRQNFDRKALLICLGGGIICDTGGFCAATFKRGIDFIFIPTTLLAQTDSCIGGKLGVDFLGYKNHIGLFQEPNAVFIHSDFLTTLLKREMKAGFSEVIKHALIADRAMWNMIKSNTFEKTDWNALVPRSVEIKKSVVEQDFKEAGVRKILNFGHTAGHALETYFVNRKARIRHGETVAAGMICESYISSKLGFLSAEDLASVCSYILEIFGKLAFPEEAIDEIISYTKQDKKNYKGKLHMPILKSVGSIVIDEPVSFKRIEESLKFYLEVKKEELPKSSSVASSQ